MTEPAALFGYTNISGRPEGQVLRAAGLVLPGVRRVLAQVGPYAQAWQRANSAALAEDGPLWVALGDSMTLGLGASAFDNGWVGQLGRVLTRDGRPFRVVNLAFSGARAADVLDRQLPALRGLPAPPDLVTVLIGANDMLRRRYRDTLPATMALLLAALPGGTVMATLPQPRPPAPAVNALIRRAAAERGLIVADMRRSGPATWRGRLASDHFHPNDLGYAGIAAGFAATIAGQPALGCPAVTGPAAPSCPAVTGPAAPSCPAVTGPAAPLGD
jgi:lysophospholipase L1-like esterase